ncbi:MAG: hypothetical protein WBC66_14400, partial [Candidatus Acidiferrales bacterium]
MSSTSSTRKMAKQAPNEAGTPANAAMRASAKTESKPEVTMADVFGPGGVLEKCHPGYEFRAAQLEMAEMVDEAFARHQHALIEA